MARSAAAPTTRTIPNGPRSRRLPDSLWLMPLFPRPSDPPLRLDFQGSEALVLGRDEGCSLQLAGADISRRHARFERGEAGISMTDLSSHNGTFVNAARATSAPVAPGDILRFGGTVMLLTTSPGLPIDLAPGLLAGPLLQAALGPVMRAATSELPVVLQGETGTGKEVVARAIHHWSGRTGPFVAVNCAALPEGLAEGELFGYRRGAFTGAERPSPGFFRSAHRGTLLLDEISDLPRVIQAKLLRVLEERVVQPLGETAAQAVDVRVVVATQGSLHTAVASGQFREDLLARLNGITVRLPPLRERVGDVPALFLRVLSELGAGHAPAVEADFVEQLCLHDYPFNVREVVLLARRLHALAGDRKSLKASDLVDQRQEDVPRPGAAKVDLPALLTALRASQGNIAQAAASLGITRQRAYRMMQGHEVDLDGLRSPQGSKA
jgi:transcriptional regulator of acetoin/glycerol metabolism